MSWRFGDAINHFVDAGNSRHFFGTVPSKFGRKMEAAIAAFLIQRNIDEAAKSVGISPNTLLNWMRVPEFQAAYREARRAAYSQAVAKLQQGATAAATTLLDQGTPASVKVRAAECVMTHSAKAIEIEDIEARVSELERAAGPPKARQ
jgi:hypothetical protein